MPKRSLKVPPSGGEGCAHTQVKGFRSMCKFGYPLGILEHIPPINKEGEGNHVMKIRGKQVRIFIICWRTL